MYLGVEVTQVSAVDTDDGDNGRVSYGFYYDNNYVSQTPEFSINKYTGIITALRVFDREEKDVYVVSRRRWVVPQLRWFRGRVCCVVIYPTFFADK